MMHENPICSDCAGFDYDGMQWCAKHSKHFCRECTCTSCEDEAWYEYEEDGVFDLEDQLDIQLDKK